MNLRWHEIPYVAIDTETTGFSKEDRICEIALVLARGGETIREYHTLVNPERLISPDAMAVHGITNDMAADAPRWEEVEEHVLDLLRLDAPWVAHNLNFDTRMLSYHIDRSRWPRGVYTLCTQEFSKRHHPALMNHRNHKLANIATILGLNYDYREVHGALYDARLLAEIVPRMMDDRFVASNYTRMSEEWLK